MIRDRVRSARGIAAAALIAIAATFLRGAAPPPVDGAQTDLSYTSAAVWTVDPAHGRVHVLLNVNATSHAADSGGRRWDVATRQVEAIISMCSSLRLAPIKETWNPEPSSHQGAREPV